MNKEEIFESYPEVKIYLRKIVEASSPQKVILFGSKATGKAKKTSDADFAIVTSEPFDENHVIGALDIVNYAKVDETLREQIDNEGIVLYEQKNQKVS